MKANGHDKVNDKVNKVIDALPDSKQESKQSRDTVIDSELQAPTKPAQKFTCSGISAKNTEPYKYYKSIEWDEWWNEFTTSIDKLGKLKYKTAWQFIQAKTSNKKQRQWLYEMIGPMPNPPTNLKVPWLGDWQNRRASGFWSVQDARSMMEVKKALKQKQDSLDAARAVAPLTVQQMTRFTRLLEKIDQAFGGEPFLDSVPPDHPKNKARFKAYTGMMQAATRMQDKAIELWFKAHGLDPAQPEQWLQMAMVASGQVGAASALVGAKTGIAGLFQAIQSGTINNQNPGNLTLESLLPDGLTKFDLQLAQHTREKAELYDLSPPVSKEQEPIPISKKTH